MKVLATVFDTVKKLVRRSRSGDLIEIPGIVAGSANVQALTAASTIAPTAYGIPVSSTENIELTSEPAIAIATEWQQIVIFNAGNYTITFRDVSIQSTSGLSIAGGKLKLKSGTTAAFWFLAGRWCYAGNITTPAPPINSVQFNDNDAFGGSENLTWDGNQLFTNGRILIQNILSPSSNSFGIKDINNNSKIAFNLTSENESLLKLNGTGSNCNYNINTNSPYGLIEFNKGNRGVFAGSRYSQEGYIGSIDPYPLYLENSGSPIILCPNAGGNTGLVQIGRRIFDNNAAVGAGLEIWTANPPNNLDNIPALSVLKPGGSSGSVFSVAASGSIVSALSSDAIGLELKLASGQSQDAFRIKDVNNNLLSYFNNDGNLIINKSSITIGSTSTVSLATYSTCIGSGAVVEDIGANEISPTAIGYQATAKGKSVALGSNANVSTSGGTAIGYGASTSGIVGIALGLGAVASAHYSTALGYVASATGGNAISIGAGASASGGIALGWSSSASSGIFSVNAASDGAISGLFIVPRGNYTFNTPANMGRLVFNWEDNSSLSALKTSLTTELLNNNVNTVVSKQYVSSDIPRSDFRGMIDIATVLGQTQNAFTIRDSNNNLLTYFNSIGQLTFNGLANSTNRLAQINTTGTIIPFEEYITNSTTINLLINNANWDGASYVGSAIAGTSKSQKYFDDDYFYIFKTDSTPVRIPLNPQVSGGSSENLWTPTQIATYFWYDANDSASVVPETGISQINDLSGNARHLTQITASEQPALTANSLNGFSAISFDGGDSLSNASVNISNIKFLIIVFRQSVSQSDFAGLIGGDFISTTSSQFISLRKELDSTLLIDSAIASTTYNIVAYKLEANDAALYVNGTLIGTDTSYTAFSGGTLSLGGGGVVNLIGEVIEGVGFDYVPTNSVIDKLFGYLAHKLQVTSKLSGIHPYKVNPPTI